MKTHDIMQWYNAEELHKASQDWLVELEFIKDEQLFLEDLLTSNTVKLIDTIGFIDDVKIIDALKLSQKRNDAIIKAVKKHDKNLKILLDGIDQPEEEKLYKKEHRNLMNLINEHLKDYKILKTQLFTALKKVFKKEKQKRLTS